MTAGPGCEGRGRLASFAPMAHRSWHRRHDLTADVWLYPTVDGGKTIAALAGYRCPCFVARDTRPNGWDAQLDIGDEPFEPGTRRRIGFWFLTREGAEAIRWVGHFYLWDGRFVGEADVLTQDVPAQDGLDR